jgi:hypothetical protein
MPQATLVKRMHISVLLCGMICAHPFPVGAQGPPHQEQAEKGGTQERQGEERPEDLVNELQQRYRARKQLRREFLQTLQQQMTALHEHATVMEGISDERRLLREMKKHMQMTDAVLGTLVEQRAAREAQKSIHGEQPGRQPGRPRQTEQSEPKEHAGDREPE